MRTIALFALTALGAEALACGMPPKEQLRVAAADAELQQPVSLADLMAEIDAAALDAALQPAPVVAVAPVELAPVELAPVDDDDAPADADDDETLTRSESRRAARRARRAAPGT